MKHHSIQIILTANIKFLVINVARRLHQTVTMTIYMINLSFSHYENSYIQAHEQVFHTNYISFLHTTMTEVLLNEIYQTVKSKINSMLTDQHLNFFSDESINIQKKRVINLCMHISKTATSEEEEFHLKTEVEVIEIMNAKTQAVWLFNLIDKTFIASAVLKNEYICHWYMFYYENFVKRAWSFWSDEAHLLHFIW